MHRIIKNEAIFRCSGKEEDIVYERIDRNFCRAFRGRPVVVVIRINTGQNRQTDDSEHYCHSNETWGQIRRLIMQR